MFGRKKEPGETHRERNRKTENGVCLEKEAYLTICNRWVKERGWKICGQEAGPGTKKDKKTGWMPQTFTKVWKGGEKKLPNVRLQLQAMEKGARGPLLNLSPSWEKEIKTGNN